MVLEVHTLKNRDPDNLKLRSLLEAQMACERMDAARSLIAHLLAISGAILWLEAIWPGLIGAELRFFAVATFGANLILALGVVLEGILWRVRRKRCRDANEPM
jgi:hypothetical protein